MLAPSALQASWVSKITGVDINIPAGKMRVSTPQPQAIPEMLKNLPKDAANFFLNPNGPALAFAIRQAAAQARGSSRPVPDSVRGELAPYFPANVLARARFTTRSQAQISVASGLLEVNGDIGAITVDDIIVFKGDAESENLSIWAHELVHITQYKNMGVEGFAAIYASPGAFYLERAAYSWQDHVVAQLNARGTAGSGNRADQWEDDSQSDARTKLQWSDFKDAARQSIPPEQCAQWSQSIPDLMAIANVCPIAIQITSFAMNGGVLACHTDDCLVLPNKKQTFFFRNPGTVQGIWFSFAQ